MAKPTQKEKPLTTGDVAKYCHVTHVGVLKWIKNGKLRAYSTPGGHYRVLPQDFRHFLEEYNMPIDETFFGGRMKRILVVSNDPTDVERITQVLKSDSATYTVATASDGYETGLQVATFKPDVIVADVTTARCDGCELCRRVKSSPETRHIKVLGITGPADVSTKNKILSCGADDYVTKPLQNKELKAHVRTLVGFTRRKEDVPSPQKRAPGTE